MSFFIKNETYKVTITHPDTEETAEVELRPLNAGDTAAFSDTIAMTMGEEPSIRLGSLRLMMVERAVVSWSLEVAPSRSTIERLDPRVFEQIFQAIESPSSPLETGEKSSENS